MPHQCTNCARVFADGSKEMLSGCPNCGGNKFQFRPEGADGDVAPDAEPPDPPEPSGSSTVARTVGKTASTVRDLVGGSDSSERTVGADRPDPLGGSGPSTSREQEDSAQASARTDVVRPEELPSGVETDTEHRFDPVHEQAGPDAAGEPADRDDGSAGGSIRSAAATASAQPVDPDADSTSTVGERTDRPDLEELRAELNDQFESIKVLSPGQYELNLMELYDREEYIVALQEDGRYSIQVPENFRE